MKWLFLFLFASSIEALKFRKSPSYRHLQLNCLPDEQDILIRENDNLLSTRHRLDRYSQGDISIGFVKGIRRRSKPYYQNVVNNIIMTLCDLESEKERCVPSNSSLAAKDWDDKCILAADTICPTGYCERSSNCYWNPVVTGENRTTRFEESAFDEAEDKLIDLHGSSYARDLAILSIAWIVIAVVLLLLWIIYFIGRYCCCCLWTSCSIFYMCSPIPREDGYRVCSQWVMPSMIYFLGLVGIVVCMVMSLIGNEDISAATTDTFAFLSLLMGDLGTFLSRSKMPLIAVSTIVTDAAVDAFSIFNDTMYVRTSADDILSSFSDFMPLHMSGLKQSDNERGFISSQSAFSDNVNPVVDSIQNMLDTLENDIYNNVDSIESSLDTAVSQIDSFENRTYLWQRDIHDYEGIEMELRPYRLFGVLLVFMTSLIIIFAGLIGIMFSRNYKMRKLHGLLDVAGFFSALLGSVAFIITSASMLISFAWYDACEISEIVTSDFEPILGENLAKGANAIFNNTNLAVAFNVTNQIDFEQKLDEGINSIREVNISKEFDLVIDPLRDIQNTIGDISSDSLEYFNDATTTSLTGCMFNDEYTRQNILEPWKANQGKGMTSWKVSTNGEYAGYQRQGIENSTEYITRVYSITGMCDENAVTCCLNDDCNRTKDEVCNKGDDCIYPIGCLELSKGIVQGYAAYLQAFDVEKKITADLGIACPSKLSDSSPITCPTQEFVALGHKKTLVGLVKAYGNNITNTANSLINIATTSVGDSMDHVQDFLCNMNVSFVEGRYNQVRDEVCGTMLGGFAQINFSLLMLAIILEINAVMANILSTRLRGISKSEAMELEEGNLELRASLQTVLSNNNPYV